MFDFLRILIDFFDRNNIPYMLSGSMAMSAYTVPRFTRNFDFIVHLKKEHIPKLLEEFREGYYCDEDAVKYFMILKNETYRQVEFERKRKMSVLDMSLFLVSPEDLLISKIIWIQDIQGNLQAEDIKALAALPQLDWQYIQHWINALKLNTFGLLDDRHA
jgi:hypothetical protein